MNIQESKKVVFSVYDLENKMEKYILDKFTITAYVTIIGWDDGEISVTLEPETTSPDFEQFYNRVEQCDHVEDIMYDLLQNTQIRWRYSEAVNGNYPYVEVFY